MRVIETIDAFRAEGASATRPLGLAPTMGALHEGHRSLLRRARADNATLVCSLFVNPKQFNAEEDFASYPRDRSRDLAIMEEDGVDLVFAPAIEEMYPRGFDTSVDVGRVAKRLEGERRPGHFRSVATVVCKLLSIVRPDSAYFGQKDAQQALVIRRLNADLNLGARIVVCPTAREADGLALSSRNALLRPEERAAAAALHRALRAAASARASSADAGAMRQRMRDVIAAEPLIALEYASVADASALDELAQVDRPALVSIAARVGRVRLIDNITLD